jgi:trimethylamine:corrinoid methyltransferase-like protein
MEGALAALASGVGRQNLLHALGFNGNANVCSPEQILIHDELAAMVERLRQGIIVNEERLAYESFARVGPGGEFLTDPLTLSLLRRGEHHYGDLLDVNESHEPAEQLYVRAHERVEAILQRHEPGVPERVVEDIRSFVARRASAVGARQVEIGRGQLGAQGCNGG